MFKVLSNNGIITESKVSFHSSGLKIVININFESIDLTMLIALTGTPGTGKSTISEKLRDEKYIVLDINKIIKENDFIISYDETRDTYEADVDRLEKYLLIEIKDLVEKSKDEDLKPIFFEGHLSHLLNMLDKVIILRCHPTELASRLRSKNWSDHKVKENMEAEALDVILIEALERYSEDNIFEINTTNSHVDEILKQIEFILNGDRDGYEPGNIDWSEEILKWY